MQDDAKRLEPCPKCHSEDVKITSPCGKRAPFCAACNDCGIQTAFYASKAETITAWNVRTPAPASDDATPAQVSREDRFTLIAYARIWWERNMPNSRFVSATVKGDGRVDVAWNDDDESGRYTLPVDFIAAITTPSTAIEDAKPVAWMYERECNEVESAATVINITRWSEEQARGWTETPLYAHPPAPAQPAPELVEVIAAALARCDGLYWDETCGREIPDGDECDSGTCVAAHWEDHDAEYARRWYMHRARAALAAMPVGDGRHGWVFFNPDTGIEYATSHPIESGEVPDAEDVRPATDFEADIVRQLQAALTQPAATPPADADAGLVELVKLLADVLEKELGDRADPSLDEEELIGWLGEEYGRQTIAGRIRLNQARERLAALGQGGVR